MLHNKPSTEEHMVDAIALIKQEGIEQGIERGRQEGERQQAIQTAKRMLDRQIDIQTISDITELSLEDIAKIDRESQS